MGLDPLHLLAASSRRLFESLCRNPNPGLKISLHMDKYKMKPQQHEWESKRRRPVTAVDEGRRTKTRKENETTGNSNNLHNGSSGTNSNSICFYLHGRSQPNGEGGSRGRSPRPGFDPQTDDKLLYKTSIKSPHLLPRRSVKEKKVVNWRLACFMSNEYLTRGTLLGRPWPPQDSNSTDNKSKPESGSLDEKKRLYHTLADFLQAGDVHLPGIVNPFQLAAWIGFN